MFARHTNCHAALTVVYGVTGGILLLENAIAHAICAFAAAVIYAVLTLGSGHFGSAEPPAASGPNPHTAGGVEGHPPT